MNNIFKEHHNIFKFSPSQLFLLGILFTFFFIANYVRAEECPVRPPPIPQGPCITCTIGDECRAAGCYHPPGGAVLCICSFGETPTCVEPSGTWQCSSAYGIVDCRGDDTCECEGGGGGGGGGGGTPDFSVDIVELSRTIEQGQSTTYNVNVTPYNNYSGTVNLSQTGCPAGASCTLSPESITFTNDSPNPGTSVLSVTNTSGVSPNTYTLTVTGNDGTLSRSDTANLVVNESRLAICDSTWRKIPASRIAYGACTENCGSIGSPIGTYIPVGFSSNTIGVVTPWFFSPGPTYSSSAGVATQNCAFSQPGSNPTLNPCSWTGVWTANAAVSYASAFTNAVFTSLLNNTWNYYARIDYQTTLGGPTETVQKHWTATYSWDEVMAEPVTWGTPTQTVDAQGRTWEFNNSQGASYRCSAPSPACVSWDPPANVSPGQTFTVNVTMRNNTGQIWKSINNPPGNPNPHRLGSYDSSYSPWTTIWQPGRWELPQASVNPGENVTFNVSVTAPSTTGTYNNFGFKMVQEGVTWFDYETCGPTTITVQAKPTISLNPTTFTFNGTSGGATPAVQTLTITNSGAAGSTLNWTGTTNMPWCHISSASGSLASGASQNISLTVDAPSNVGTFSCTITISDSNATNSPQTANVTYTVIPGNASGITTSIAACPSRNVTVSWTAGAGADSYQIFRNTTATLPGTPLTTVGAVTSYVDSTVVTGNTYYYWVRARQAASGLLSPNAVGPSSIAVSACAQPDLIIQSPSISGSLTSGTSLSFSGTVRNQGGAAAAASQTRLRIDINNNGSYDVNPANQATGALAASATETETWSNAWTAVVGTHKYEICADVGGAVAESNEGNNCVSNTFTVVSGAIACTTPSPGNNQMIGCVWDWNPSFGGSSSFSDPDNVEKGNAPAQAVITTPTDSATIVSFPAGSTAAGLSDYFLVRWQGNFNFTAGNYELIISSPDSSGPDDGFRVFIDSTQISPESEWASQCCQGNHTYTVNNLTAGVHLVKLEFMEIAGGQEISLRWNKLAVPPPPNGGGPKTWNTAATSTVACNTIKITWAAPLSGPAPTYYRVFRYTSDNPSSASQVGGNLPATTFSYTDSSPLDPVNNYYWVEACNANGCSTRSSGKAYPSPISTILCEANLSSSDKDIVAVNGTVYPASDCLAPGENPPALAYKVGDIIKFSINICNTGTQDATAIYINDTLVGLERKDKAYSLTQREAWNLQTTGGVSLSSIEVVSGAEPNLTLRFNLSGSIPQGSSAELTFEAKTAVPAGYSGVSSRFQNSAIISYIKSGANRVTKTALTPLLLFIRTQVPTIIEVAP